MRHLLKCSALAAVAAFTVPAIAQEPASENQQSTIVVEGLRVDERQVATFIDALTDVAVGAQISRFDHTACPTALGLGADRNAEIVSRLRAVAEAAGMRVGEQGCRPNVIVIVTRNKRDFIEQLDSRYPVYFTGLSAGEVERLAQSTGPVAAWQVRGSIGPDGQEVPVALPDISSNVDVVVDGDGHRREGPSGNLIGAGYSVVDTTYVPGRLRAAARPHFAAAIVVVEVGALGGLTTTQFADYAAMRTFADTDPVRVSQTGVPTILKAVDAPLNTPVPLTLTHWDLSFLRALYAIPQNHFANIQRSNMRQLITDELFALSEQPAE